MVRPMGRTPSDQALRVSSRTKYQDEVVEVVGGYPPLRVVGSGLDPQGVLALRVEDVVGHRERGAHDPLPVVLDPRPEPELPVFAVRALLEDVVSGVELPQVLTEDWEVRAVGADLVEDLEEGELLAAEERQ